MGVVDDTRHDPPAGVGEVGADPARHRHMLGPLPKPRPEVGLHMGSARGVTA
jgi:hypothetical protein